MKTTGLYPRVHIDRARVAAVGQAGGVLLTETIRVTGLGRGLSEALAGGRVARGLRPGLPRNRA